MSRQYSSSHATGESSPGGGTPGCKLPVPKTVPPSVHRAFACLGSDPRLSCVDGLGCCLGFCTEGRGFCGARTDFSCFSPAFLTSWRWLSCVLGPWAQPNSPDLKTAKETHPCYLLILPPFAISLGLGLRQGQRPVSVCHLGKKWLLHFF